MGQVFTDKVDVALLKEGAMVNVRTRWGGSENVLFFNNGVWCVQDEGDKTTYWDVCRADGSVMWHIDYLEFLDVPDPAEKMQAEHAEMLYIIGSAADAPWSNGDVRKMARDFLAKRKDA